MTNDEFEQLEFTYCDAIIKAEQVYRDTEGDLSRAIIAAILHENKALLLVLDKARESLAECDEAMNYMSEYDIPLCMPDRVKSALTAISPYAEAIKKVKNHV